MRLLDWGKRAMSADSSAPFVARLLKKYAISLVVVRALKRGERRDTARVRRGLRAIRAAARRHSIPVVALADERVRKFFREYERYTKYDIALFMTTILPELAWLLPRPRKFFMPENRRMALFHAVALGIAFLGMQEDGDLVRESLASAAGVF